MSKLIDGKNSISTTGTITAGTFNAESDYRIKDNIISMKDTNYSIDKLHPVYYYNKNTKKNDIGFIAHEVQEEFPFLVTGVKDAPVIQSLNYIGLIGLLVNEIQLLKNKIK